MAQAIKQVKQGDRVKIKGVWAEIDGKDVFMASKVKKGDYFQFKVRLTAEVAPELRARCKRDLDELRLSTSCTL